MTLWYALPILNKAPYASKWELSSGPHTAWLQLSLYGRGERRDFREDQNPNYSGIYRVKSTSLKGNFKQIRRLWEIGIMHSL